MQPYSIDIFNRNLQYKSHTNIQKVPFREDYLDPENNTVDVYSAITCEIEDYIWIHRDNESYGGQITKIEDKGKYAQITYKTLLSLFSNTYLCNTDDLGEGTIENYIGRVIMQLFVNNADQEQNIPYAEVAIKSATSSWMLDIVPDTETSSYALINFFKKVIIPAFEQYSIVVTPHIDFKAKKVTFTVEKNTKATKTIESDFPNVMDKSIVVRKQKKMVNKVTTYNKNNFSMVATYFLHTDDTFDKNNTDRVTPVQWVDKECSTPTTEEQAERIASKINSAIQTIDRNIGGHEVEEDALQSAVDTVNDYLSEGLSIVSGTVYQNGTALANTDGLKTDLETYTGSQQNIDDGQTESVQLFEDAAYKNAETTFKSNRYDNYIEITCALDDTLINPSILTIGQVTNVVSNGVVYPTILTGRKVSDKYTLVFGTIRLELTKQLKERN